MEQKIGLATALTGGSFTVTHLDQRKLLLKIPSGEVIRPGSIKVIENQGMPTYRNPFQKGNLVISFSITFPPNHWIPQNDLQKLAQVSSFFSLN